MSTFIPIQCLQREYAANRERFLSAFDAVCSAAAYCDGDFVHRFEREFADYLGVKNCSGVNSGTSALFLTMKALGVGEGDEVIVPAETFFSTASTAAMIGAVPVFADCDRDTWQISPESVARLLTEKTKLIVGVHLYGGAFDVRAIGDLAAQAGVPFIEDACQAAGTRIADRCAGTFGAAGCFSFYPTKNLGAFGEGGAVVSADDSLKETVDFLKKHARTPDGDHARIGFNMRMDGIQSAVLSEKLRLLPKTLERRRKIAALYAETLKDNPALVAQKSLPDTRHAYHLFVVKPQSRARFIGYMTDRGIGTGVHYPIPCHRLTAFCGKRPAVSLPNTEDLFAKCVSVPVDPYLTDAEVEQVAEALKQYRE